jgi:hypothetical protein
MKLTLSPVISVAEFRKRKAEWEELQKASQVEKATAVLKVIDKEIKHQLLSEGGDRLSFSVLNTLLNTNKELELGKDQRIIAAIHRLVVEELRQGGWLVLCAPDYRIVITEPQLVVDKTPVPESQLPDPNNGEVKVSTLRGIHDHALLSLKGSLE